MKKTLEVRLARVELVSEGYEFDGMLELNFDCEEESVGLHLSVYMLPERAKEQAM